MIRNEVERNCKELDNASIFCCAEEKTEDEIRYDLPILLSREVFDKYKYFIELEIGIELLDKIINFYDFSIDKLNRYPLLIKGTDLFIPNGEEVVEELNKEIVKQKQRLSSNTNLKV